MLPLSTLNFIYKLDRVLCQKPGRVLCQKPGRVLLCQAQTEFICSHAQNKLQALGYVLVFKIIDFVKI